jgi:hypothetical protein
VLAHGLKHMQTDQLTDFLREVDTKRIELGAASTKAVLQELMKDAAGTWRTYYKLGSTIGAPFVAYPYRVFSTSGNVYALIERVLTRIETGDVGSAALADLVADFGEKPSGIDLPTPVQARRLMIMTLIPYSKRGVAGNKKVAWRLLWQDAVGDTAPKIAAALERITGRRVKREQIWRIRDHLYDALAAAVDDAASVARAA